VLAIFVLLALVWTIVLIAQWNAGAALFGWNLGADGRTLIYVTPGGAASRAGVRAGDRIDWSTLPLVGRVNLAVLEGVSAGTRLRVTVMRENATRTVVLAPKAWPKILEIASRAATMAGLFLLAIGIALVQLRPSRMTWGFLFASLLWAYPPYISWQWAQSASWRFIVGDGGFSLLNGAYAAGILIFMSRFPSDTPRGSLRVLDRCAIPFGVAVAALGLYVDAMVAYAKYPPPAWALFTNQSLIEMVLFAVALAALLTTFALTKSSDRHRIVPVLITYALYVACTMGNEIYRAFYTDAAVHATFRLLTAASMIAVAIAVAHGVVRHRVLDVSFAISRTVVYTILTSIIVGVFVLIDFVSSKLLDRLQFAIVLEVAAALAFGIWLNALHTRIDKLVDRVLFRKRHLAEARLQRVENALAYAQDSRFVDEALVLEPAEALDLASAAVFRQSDNVYERMYSSGWDGTRARLLDASNRLVIHLRAELDVLDVSSVHWRVDDIPSGLAQPLVAIPLCVRHELLGFVLYGGHSGGEALDPDEISQLKSLAHAGAGAYDHIESQALRKRIAEAQIEIAQLRHGEEVVRQMLQAMRGAGEGVES
jgi:hypothetical protein